MATLTTTINYSEPAGSIIVSLATPGPAGPGVPSGGTAGQVLAKINGVSYNTEWVTPQDDSAVWGQITGNLSDQGDLQGALDAKLDVSTAASTYYLQTNPLGFITASALAPYLPLAGGYITGDIQSLNGSEFRTFQSPNSAIIRPNQIQLGDAVGSITVDAGGITFNSSALKQTTPFLGLDGYATESWVTSGFYPLVGNPSGFIDSTDLSAALSGYIPIVGQTIIPAGQLTFNNGAGTIDISADDGFVSSNQNGTPAVQIYGGTFMVTNGAVNTSIQATGITFPDATVQTTAYTGGGGLITSVTSPLAVNSGDLSIDLAAYAPLAGATFTGKVNMAAPTIGSASLNLGVGTAPTTSVAGDIWIATNINFRDSSGTLKLVANTNTTNTFTQAQVISNNGAAAALRITQIGTGPTLIVEDEITPDTSAFQITNEGRVGVNVSSVSVLATSDLYLNKRSTSAYGCQFVSTVTGDLVYIWHTNATDRALWVARGISQFDNGIRVSASGPVISQILAPVVGTGIYDKEIAITINGTSYAIPCRVI